jgi:hypothetical protein
MQPALEIRSHRLLSNDLRRVLEGRNTLFEPGRNLLNVTLDSGTFHKACNATPRADAGAVTAPKIVAFEPMPGHAP